jgi:hypothetical protein
MPRVLKVDPISQTATFIGPSLPGRTKFYGGIKAGDSIYAAPYGSPEALTIDTITDEVILVPLPESIPTTTYGWHGGVYHAGADEVYFFPSHSRCAIRIRRSASGDVYEPVGDFGDLKYKFGGGIVRGDHVYLIPSDYDAVGRIDTRDGSVALLPLPESIVAGGKNKFQGGVKGADGKIYFIPSNADKVLILELDDRLSLLEGLEPGVADKFQGGEELGGDVYLVNENYDCCVKIDGKSGQIVHLR